MTGSLHTHFLPQTLADPSTRPEQRTIQRAFLCQDVTRYRPHAPEGRQADFAPTAPLQVELLRCLLHRFEHLSYERLCYGRGLPEIYACFKERGR